MPIALMPITQLPNYAMPAPRDSNGETLQSCQLASLQRGVHINIGLLTFSDNLHILPNGQLLSLQDE